MCVYVYIHMCVYVYIHIYIYIYIALVVVPLVHLPLNGLDVAPRLN
jgi:hypothetical protein